MTTSTQRFPSNCHSPERIRSTGHRAFPDLANRVLLLTTFPWKSPKSQPESFSSLKKHYEPTPHEPDLKFTPCPISPSKELFFASLRPPGLFSRLLGGQRRYEQAFQAATDAFARAQDSYRTALNAWELGQQALRQEHDCKETAKRLQVEHHNETIDRLEAEFLSGDSEAISQYFALILQNAYQPLEFEPSFITKFQERKRLLTVYATAPSKSDIPIIEQFVRSTFRAIGEEDKHPNKYGDPFLQEMLSRVLCTAEGCINELYSDVLAVFTAHIVSLLFKADPCSCIDSVILNGHTCSYDALYSDKSGPFLLSVRTSRKEYDKYLANQTNLPLKYAFLNPTRTRRLSEMFLNYPDPYVDLAPCVIMKETLPLPFVHYPNRSGVFLGFAEANNAEIFLCSCAATALDNYWHFRQLLNEKSIFFPLEQFHPSPALPQRNVNPDLDFFPPQVAERLTVSEHYLPFVRFKPNLCHKCNRASPSTPYCHRDLANAFVARYGWYLNQAFLRYGIFPHEIGLWAHKRWFFYQITSLDVPDDVRTAFNAQQAAQDEYLNECRGLKTAIRELRERRRSELNDDDPDVIKYKRVESMLFDSATKLVIAVENVVRSEFGESKVGEVNWPSETSLYKIVCELFPSFTVKQNWFPECLGGLQLDIFIPELRLGIEYQGAQHFIPVSIFGGEAHLHGQIERDRRKARLCKKNGIALIYVKYTEPLTKEHIAMKLRRYLPKNES